MAESIAVTEAVSAEQARGIIQTFTIVRDLGILATDLHQQAKEVAKQASDITPEDLEMPAGTVLIVRPTGHEDPMDTEAYIEVDRSDWPIFAGASNEWSFVSPGQQPYKDNVEKTAHDVPVFRGKTLKQDTETGKIWVYNETENFRVLYRKGIKLSLDSTDADSD